MYALRRLSIVALSALSMASIALPAHAGEVVRITPDNYDKVVPRGKEVDAIYGDYVLRNDKVVAVIGDPVATRHANLTVHNVAGCLLDFTSRANPNDQLSAYYPDAARYGLRSAIIEQQGKHAVLLLTNKPTPGQPNIELRYILRDGDEYITIETKYLNTGDKPLQARFSDSYRADRTFQKGSEFGGKLVTVYDRWHGQAYGFLGDGSVATAVGGGRGGGVQYKVDGKAEATVEPGKQVVVRRRVIPGANLFDVIGVASKLTGEKRFAQHLTVKDKDGPVANADVRLGEKGSDRTMARTDANGKVTLWVPKGTAQITAAHHARGEGQLSIDSGNEALIGINLQQAGYVSAKVTDDKGQPIPCKVQFVGREGTKDPYFFTDTGTHAVINAYYSHNGSFKQAIAPGDYDVIVSHGPEYDADFLKVRVTRGKTTAFQTKLKRTVSTPGWVSTEYHSHSSPSGDNTSDQLGRVLNLLAEQIDFAPCTEHQRIDTYVPHLKALKAEHLMGTASGIEMTGRDGSVNHQNIFPLKRKPRTQDGGAPTVHTDPRVQVERIAYWDDKSEKLVQQNHPDLVRLAWDRNRDGKHDGGYNNLSFMDVIELHPPQAIFQPAVSESRGRKFNNRMVNWMQMLNHGFRIPGVVNTDAHYNFHGSGWYRNWVKSSTDDPAKIKVLDIVRASEKGNIVMSTGPYLEVQATTSAHDSASAGPGDSALAIDGKVGLGVRVQCPNWFDINRIQVFVNGRPDPRLNFTRKSHAKLFSDKVVKFDQAINVTLKEDAHLIVVAIGEGLKLGKVMGPQRGNLPPIAVANPIFIDVDGKGFKPNGDDLGHPLPKK